MKKCHINCSQDVLFEGAVHETSSSPLAFGAAALLRTKTSLVAQLYPTVTLYKAALSDIAVLKPVWGNDQNRYRPCTNESLPRRWRFRDAAACCCIAVSIGGTELAVRRRTGTFTVLQDEALGLVCRCTSPIKWLHN